LLGLEAVALDLARLRVLHEAVERRAAEGDLALRVRPLDDAQALDAGRRDAARHDERLP